MIVFLDKYKSMVNGVVVPDSAEMECNKCVNINRIHLLENK